MTATTHSRAQELATFAPHRFLQVARTAPRKVRGLVADGVGIRLPPGAGLTAVLAQVNASGHATGEAAEGGDPLLDAALAVLTAIVGALAGGGDGGKGTTIRIASNTLTVQSASRDGDSQPDDGADHAGSRGGEGGSGRH